MEKGVGGWDGGGEYGCGVWVVSMGVECGCGVWVWSMGVEYGWGLEDGQASPPVSCRTLYQHREERPPTRGTCEGFREQRVQQPCVLLAPPLHLVIAILEGFFHPFEPMSHPRPPAGRDRRQRGRLPAARRGLIMSPRPAPPRARSAAEAMPISQARRGAMCGGWRPAQPG